jgi:S1-C subfamily serine protease
MRGAAIGSRPKGAGIIRWSPILVAFLAALLLAGSPARADDISAAGRSVVRVIVIPLGLDGEPVGMGFGSGFAVAPNRIVTNAHVVNAADEAVAKVVIGVVPSEGQRGYPAHVVFMDAAKDLALLELDTGTLPPVAINLGQIADGAHVIALGYPGNVDMATARSVRDFIAPSAPTRSEGNYSNPRVVNGTNALLHTAPLAHGNSGGPLLDQCGRVIGVNSFITGAGESGDSSFGFAISAQELASFLQRAHQGFSGVTTPCVGMAEALQADQLRQQQATAARESAERSAREGAEKDALAKALAANKDSRENRAAAAIILGVLALILSGAGGVLFGRGKERPAYWLAGAGAACLLAGGVVFFTRPARGDVKVQTPARPMVAQADPNARVGANLCRLVPERSRIVSSSAQDVELSWTAQGCMNGRTQYARLPDRWERALVPKGEQTVSVLEFRPDSGEYVNSRYLLSASEMERLRGIRSQVKPGACSADPAAQASLADQQEQIRSALPKLPNERLVYQCEVNK